VEAGTLPDLSRSCGHEFSVVCEIQLIDTTLLRPESEMRVCVSRATDCHRSRGRMARL